MPMSGFTHNVQWNEFRTVSQRPSGISEDAQISIRTLTFSFNTRQPGGADCSVTNATVSIGVDRSGSWAVQGRQSAALLQHEQGHYNITALGTRELYNQVLNLTASRCPGINTEARRLQQQIQTRINQTNIRYDTRTNHGNNAAAQRTWDSSIRAAMQNPNGTLANLPR